VYVNHFGAIYILLHFSFAYFLIKIEFKLGLGTWVIATGYPVPKMGNAVVVVMMVVTVTVAAAK